MHEIAPERLAAIVDNSTTKKSTATTQPNRHGYFSSLDSIDVIFAWTV
jgi:hypothetical protein